MKHDESICERTLHFEDNPTLQIFGRGGPANHDEVFADLWFSITSRYRNDENVRFGLYVLLAYFYFLVSEIDVHIDGMNEPHYLLNINIWAQAVKKVVSSIRSAGLVQSYWMASSCALLIFTALQCIYSRDPP